MTDTAVVAGVGPGLGAAVARRIATEGCDVGLFARSTDVIDELADEFDAGDGGGGLAVPTDCRDAHAIAEGFDAVRDAFGPVDLLVYNASTAPWTGLRATDPEEFEDAWRTTSYGAFCAAREAADDMLDGAAPAAEDGGSDGSGAAPAETRGTILVTGATSAVRGRGGAVAFSSAKFATRGLAEAMARELGPRGIHVAHAVIDGQIDTPRVREAFPEKDDHELLAPDAIADAYWDLVEQDPSAWTLELDLRPHVEAF